MRQIKARWSKTKDRSETGRERPSYGAGLWLFGPKDLLLRPRRFDRAGGEILTGQVAIDVGGGRAASCRSPSFRRYPVAPDGTLLVGSAASRAEIREAILTDRAAARRGAVGINRALMRRRLRANRRWQPSADQRRRFLSQALAAALRVRRRFFCDDRYGK